MAKNSFVIAKRYAKALWIEAASSTEAGKLMGPLKVLSAEVQSSQALRRLLKDARFTNAERWSVLSDLLKKSEAPAALSNFVKMLCEAGRAQVLTDIENAFTALVYKAQGVVEAVVETATALSNEQLAQVKSQVEKMTGKKAVISTKLAPELLAGIRIQVDGKTVDVSLKAQMARLEKEMLKTGALAQA